MGAALIELETRLDDTLSAAHFVDRAYRIRPRIGKAIKWDGPNDEVELLRAFLIDDGSRQEEAFGALLIRVVAAFERYVRQICSETILARATAASEAGVLPDDLRRRNLMMSSRLLASLDRPRDYISFNPRTIVNNLASCEANEVPFRINTVAFSASLQSPTVESVHKLMEVAGLKDVFEELGRSSAMQQHLGTRETRATNNRAQERLTEIVRWRNNLAHGGDEERSITIEQLDLALEFVRIAARGIDAAIYQLKW